MQKFYLIDPFRCGTYREIVIQKESKKITRKYIRQIQNVLVKNAKLLLMEWYKLGHWFSVSAWSEPKIINNNEFPFNNFLTRTINTK